MREYPDVCLKRDASHDKTHILVINLIYILKKYIEGGRNSGRLCCKNSWTPCVYIYTGCPRSKI